MRVAILGGSGFIGPRVAAALSAAGHEAQDLSRTSGANRNDPASIVRALANADVLIDMIAYDIATTAPLLEAIAGRVGRYVLISSADVYRHYGALHRLEDAPTIALLDENAPLRTRLYPYRRDQPRASDDPNAWQDDYDKIPIERAARAHTDLEATILRLPMVYGPNDKQQRFRWITQPMRGGADIAAPRAWLDWITTYGHVENVGAAIACAATHTAAANATMNIGEEPVPHRTWIKRFAAATGWTGVVHDDEAAPIAAMLSGLDLSIPLALDASRLAALGFIPPLSPEVAIASVL